MATERKPQKHIKHERSPNSNGYMCRVDTLRTLWYRACFTKKDVALDDGSVQKVRAPNAHHVSLKAFARQLATSGQNGASRASDWLHNKRANTSNPPKRIGRTNRISKSK